MNINGLITRNEGEEIIFNLRRHWIIFLGDILMVGILAIVPLGALFLSASVWPGLLTGPISRPCLVLLGSAYYLVIWLFFIETFVDYYLDAWLVTTNRIVNVEQHGLFSRQISELDLAKVQDVTSEVIGIIPSILNYGNVYIQTAGTTERFIFEQVHRPHDIRKRILELVSSDRKQELEVITENL